MTSKDALLQEFLKANPKLANSNAEIRVDEILEKYSSETGKTVTYNPPLLEISVTYPFIFDRRLIPNKFNEYSITGGMSEEFPPEFPINDEGLVTLDVWHAPENYIAFVDKNIEKIRTELNNQMITKEEALDALTGGFEKHIEWCKTLKDTFNNSN